MGFYPFECFDAPLSSSQQQGGTSDPPGLRGRLRNERAAYEGQGGKTISRLACRTVGSPADNDDWVITRVVIGAQYASGSRNDRAASSDAAAATAVLAQCANTGHFAQ